MENNKTWLNLKVHLATQVNHVSISVVEREHDTVRSVNFGFNLWLIQKTRFSERKLPLRDF